MSLSSSSQFYKILFTLSTVIFEAQNTFCITHGLVLDSAAMVYRLLGFPFVFGSSSCNRMSKTAGSVRYSLLPIHAASMQTSYKALACVQLLFCDGQNLRTCMHNTRLVRHVCVFLPPPSS
jgi:hypothetical protein